MEKSSPSACEHTFSRWVAAILPPARSSRKTAIHRHSENTLLENEIVESEIHVGKASAARKERSRLSIENLLWEQNSVLPGMMLLL